VNVANAQEGADVGLVGLGGEGVAEEDDGEDFVGRNLCADLKVAAFGAGAQAFEFEAGGVVHVASGGARRDQREVTQHVGVPLRERGEVGLLGVVRDEGDEAWGGHGAKCSRSVRRRAVGVTRGA